MQHAHHDMKMYGDIKLYAGSGSPELAKKIANYLIMVYSYFFTITPTLIKRIKRRTSNR